MIEKCCLAVAGSDSGGNAGVQADLRAFHSFGLHGCTVLSALTAQNPGGVSAIMPVGADFVAAQLDAVLGVYAIAAAKTGMLSDPASIEVIADRLGRHPEMAKVVAPVMVATSGDRLVSDATVEAVKKLLLPLATVVTPNLPEAEVLAGVKSEGRMASAGRAAELAKRIFDLYGANVLVKGGHGGGDSASDVLCTAAGVRVFSLPWVADPVSTHGTGCTLASAIAASLALGSTLEDAVAAAKEHVHKAVEKSYFVGEGCGVLGFV